MSCGSRVSVGRASRERVRPGKVQHGRPGWVHCVSGTFHLRVKREGEREREREREDGDLDSRCCTLYASHLSHPVSVNPVGRLQLPRHDCRNGHGLQPWQVFSWKPGQLHVLSGWLSLRQLEQQRDAELLSWSLQPSRGSRVHRRAQGLLCVVARPAPKYVPARQI